MGERAGVALGAARRNSRQGGEKKNDAFFRDNENFRRNVVKFRRAVAPEIMLRHRALRLGPCNPPLSHR